MRMTERRQAIEAGRVQDVDAAHSEAHLINRLWGSFGAYRRVIGDKKWVQGANGLWCRRPR